MNHYQARQREHDKRWDWTSMNDEVIRRWPPCTDHDDGHATAELAERHFFDYEATHLKEGSVGDDEQHRCEYADKETRTRCPNWTDKWLEGRLWGRRPFLCDDHRNPATWQYLTAPETWGGIQIVASW